MGTCRQKAGTRPVVLALLLATAASAQFYSPPDVRGDCSDKSDGLYAVDHCSPFFHSCSGGVTSKLTCSEGLRFNPLTTQCDFAENIEACKDSFSCIGRDDGIYGEGCTSIFWACVGGRLTKNDCAAGTFFNTENLQCDYRRNVRACGGDPATTRSPRLRSTRVTTTAAPSTTTAAPAADQAATQTIADQTYPTYAPRQRISGTVSKTPLAESSAGAACAGKSDGAHEYASCSGKYVLCWSGTGNVLDCPASLVFNEPTSACDYPENVASCGSTTAAAAAPAAGSGYGISAATDASSAYQQTSAAPAADSAYGTAPAADTPTAILPIPRRPTSFDCASLTDGLYAPKSCDRHYIQCTNGESVERSCPEGLVYNAESQQCDYADNCGKPTTVVVPGADAPTTVAPTTTAKPEFDCTGLPDGVYSRGCIADFYQCVNGVTYSQKCVGGLVFDDHTKGCEYPEMCSAPPTTGTTPIASDAPAAYGGVASNTVATTSAAFDCSSRVDGYYAEGCVEEYFGCQNGLAYGMKCPSGLVFDGVRQVCDYRENCGTPRPLEHDATVGSYDQTVQQQPTLNPYQPAQPVAAAPAAFDCSTRSDGVYTVSPCSASFFQCVAGAVYTKECPAGLVFEEKSGRCEYPERCTGVSQDAPSETTQAPELKPTIAPAGIDCFGRPDGHYSDGCARSFVQCVSGMSLTQICPEGLVFVQDSGRCDYPENCESAPTTAAPAADAPAANPYAPESTTTAAAATAAPAAAADASTGVVIDCTKLTDGLYSSGCAHAFVQCVAGGAYPLECPAGLVFDKSTDRCVYPDNCKSVAADLPAAGAYTVPKRPATGATTTTVFDMSGSSDYSKVPESAKDGSLCTGTGRRAMGKCSSGFVQCIGGKLIARRCPGQSLFDEKIGLCVYDLEGCEMEEIDEESAAPAAAQDATGAATGYGVNQLPSQPAAPAAPTQNQYQPTGTGYAQQQQQPYQAPAQAPTQYQAQQGYYQAGYQAPAQAPQYQPVYGNADYADFMPAPLQPYPASGAAGPAYSSFDDASMLTADHSNVECEAGAVRRVSPCSASFDHCSPTARQWVRRACGKSHRFDSGSGRCRPVFEVRECDEPASSYVPPPPVQMTQQTVQVYASPATSFHGVPLTGREYEEKHVYDPFKASVQSGRMGSNPFYAIGNTGSFYAQDGFSWIGSAAPERRGLGRRHGQKKEHHDGHHGDFVLISGNPFGAGRRKAMLDDEWEGRKERRGWMGSNLKGTKGRARGVVDTFEGPVYHAEPIEVANPFAVKAGDGHRKRKNCRDRKHRRRYDWDEEDEECEREERRHKKRRDERKRKEKKDRDTVVAAADAQDEPEGRSVEDLAAALATLQETEETTVAAVVVNDEVSESVDEVPALSESEPETTETTVEEEEVEEEAEEANPEAGAGEEEENEVEDAETSSTAAVEDTTENPDAPTEEDDDVDEDAVFEEEVTNPEAETTEETVEETTVAEEEGEEAETESTGDETETVEESTTAEYEDAEWVEPEATEETTEEVAESETEAPVAEAVAEEESDEDAPMNSEAETGSEVAEESEAVNEETEETTQETAGAEETQESEESESADDEKAQKAETEADEEDEAMMTESGGEEESEAVAEEESPAEEPEAAEEESGDAQTGTGEENEAIETGSETGETADAGTDTEAGADEESETAETGSEAVAEEEATAEETTESTEESEEAEEVADDEAKTEETTEEAEPETTEETAAEGADESGDAAAVDETEAAGGSETGDEAEAGDDEAAEETEEAETADEPAAEAEAVEGQEETADETTEATVESEQHQDGLDEEQTDAELSEGEALEAEDDGTDPADSPDSIEDEDEETETGEEEEAETTTEAAAAAAADAAESEVDPAETPEGLEAEEGEEEDNGVEMTFEGGEDQTRKKRSVVYGQAAAPAAAAPATVQRTTVTRRLLVPRSSRLHRSRFSRLCVQKEAGQTISIGQCRQDFVYCKGARRPVVAACPVGDLFDAVAATCVPTEICGAEAAKVPVTATEVASDASSTYDRSGSYKPALPTGTSTTTETTVIAADVTSFSCSGRSDGAYSSAPCSSSYFVCSASQLFPYSCPNGLIYDQMRDSCQWREEMESCGGVASDASSSSSSASPYAPSLDTVSTTTVSSIHATPTGSPMHTGFKCARDGGFAIDCKGGFVLCSNGEAAIMKCPAALTFDEGTQSCQYPADVVACGLAPVVTTAAPAAAAAADPAPTQSAYTWNHDPATTTTTAPAPARPVEYLVNTPVSDKDACAGVESGVRGATRAHCPSSFVICKENKIEAVMNCPQGTYFDERTKECDYREVACKGGWTGEAHGLETGVTAAPLAQNDALSSEEYGRIRASRPYRPAMPMVVEKIEQEKEEKREEERREERPVVVQSEVEAAKDASCDWQGPAPDGACSPHFVICSNGRPEKFECAASLVFDVATHSCGYPDFVAGCPQYADRQTAATTPAAPAAENVETATDATEEEPAAAAADEAESQYSEYARDEIPSTTTQRPLTPVESGAHTSAKFEVTGEHCKFVADKPAFPLNYCSMTYAICTSQGDVLKTNCTFGYLFDSQIRTCVPSEHCGEAYLKDIAKQASSAPQPAHNPADWQGDVRCVGVEEGKLLETAPCSATYIRCEKDSVVLEHCAGAAEVFSSITARCVNRVQSGECERGRPAITKAPKSPMMPHPHAQSSERGTHAAPAPSHRGSRIRGGLPAPASAYGTGAFDSRSFCASKHKDGLYRDPENCAGIVQCFGGEAFSYPSCSPGLFFNEQDGQCDYTNNVPECAAQADPVAMEDTKSTCNGQPHGAYLADDKDCSVFYRCVWGTLERFTCPAETVFNPRLSVCDYPSEVPHCAKGNAPY